MGGGHEHDEPFYLHAKHMYNLDRMNHQSLKMSLSVLTAFSIGVGVPLCCRLSAGEVRFWIDYLVDFYIDVTKETISRTLHRPTHMSKFNFFKKKERKRRRSLSVYFYVYLHLDSENNCFLLFCRWPGFSDVLQTISFLSLSSFLFLPQDLFPFRWLHLVSCTFLGILFVVI